MIIDKQALREAAEKAISEEGETWWNEEQLASDYGLALHRPDAKFIAAANPATVLALLDALEAKDKRIAELERDETQLIEERDSAEQALSEMYEAAMGDRPEWSNLFGYADAIDDVTQRVSFLDIEAAAGKGE